MELSEKILVIGEKIAELQDAGHHCSFRWSGHVEHFDVYVYQGKWAAHKKHYLVICSADFSDFSSFLEAFYSAANKLLRFSPPVFG